MIARLCVDRRTRWELLAGALIVGLATYLIASGSFFDRDDFFFASYFQFHPPTPGVLFRSWFGHLVPGYIATVISYLTVFGLSWPAALFFIALIHVGTFVALTRILDAVLGPVRLNVLVGLAFSLSLGPMVSRLWWAATLTNVLALAIGLAVLGCATRWVVRRRTRHLVAALVLYAVALAMSEKNLLFSIHIGLWCLLVVWRGRPIAERMREVGRTWMLWAGIAVLSLLDAVAFVGGGYLEESGTSPGIGSSLAFIVDSALAGLIPSLFGVDMGRAPGPLWDPRIIVAAVLFAAFVVWSISRVRSNGGVWIFALAGVLANSVALSRRVDLIGVMGGRNLRYLLESSALLWLAIGVVLVVSLRAGLKRAELRPDHRPNPIARIVVASACVLVLIVSTWSWAITLTASIRDSGGYASRAWITELEASLPNPPPPLIDSPLPIPFALPALHPYDMVSSVLPSLGWSDVRTTTSLEGAWVVGPDGVAGPATVANGDREFVGSRCTDGIAEIALPEVGSPGRKYIVIEFSGATEGSLNLIYDGGWTTIGHPADSGTVVIYLAGPLDGDLQIGSLDAPLCVDAVTVADVLPESSVPGNG